MLCSFYALFFCSGFAQVEAYVTPLVLALLRQ